MIMASVVIFSTINLNLPLFDFRPSGLSWFPLEWVRYQPHFAPWHVHKFAVSERSVLHALVDRLPRHLKMFSGL